MNFTEPTLAALLASWAKSADDRERAEAHNVQFEERLDRARVTSFEMTAHGPWSAHSQLRDALSDFVRTYIEVAAPHIPMTFAAANGSAALGGLSPEQKLVRLENLTRHLANSALTADDLTKSLASARPAMVATA